MKAKYERRRRFYRTTACALALLCGQAPQWALAQGASCQDPRARTRESVPAQLGPGEISLDAERVDLRAEGRSALTGNVQIQRGTDVLSAEDVIYDTDDRTISASSGTWFESDAIGVRARQARIGFENEVAEFEDADFMLFESGAHGHAGRIAIEGEGKAALDDVLYTTCPMGSRDWELVGDRFRLDATRGIGSARNVRLNFKGFPLLWLPLFYFPVGDQRRTGFLAPVAGESSETGADLRIPFYINLAPNYDFVLTPRLLARRGVMLGSTLRYLWSHGSGESSFEYLERDEVRDESRSLLAMRYSGGLDTRVEWDAAYNRVSDIAYFADFGSGQVDSARTQLPRNLRIAARGRQGLEALLLLSEFQPLVATDSIEDEPYARLPQISLGWRPRYENFRLRPSIQTDAVRFARENSVEGWRSDLRAGVDWRYDVPAGFFSAGGDVRHTRYALRDADKQDLRLSRTVPTAVAEGGLRFVRPLQSGLLQTIEPRLNYLYVPFRDQSELPVFDTSLPDFAFDQLFSRNRFTGLDRIADASLLTAALTSNLIDPVDGTRPASLRIGLQWRLQESRVTLPEGAIQDAGSSDWLGELDFRLSKSVRGIMVGQLNTDTNRLSQSVAAVRYRPRPDALLQGAYRFRRGVFEQADLAVTWPVGGKWRVAGRWTYAVDADRTIESLGGLEYKSCCWAGRIAWRRYLNGVDDQFNSSVYLQLELTGLAKLGEGIDGLLDRDILSP